VRSAIPFISIRQLRWFRACLPGFLLIVGTGCISTRADNAFLSSLKNRGAVPLSSTNPFLAGNILLAKEMDRSNDLNGFIKSRGTPQALEVSKSWSGPATIQLYYLDRNEYYTAEESGSNWIINGPSRIPPKGVDLLQTLTEFGQKPAALELNKSDAASSTPEQYTSGNSSSIELAEPASLNILENLPSSSDNRSTLEELVSSPPATPPSISNDPVVDRINEIRESVAEDAEVSPRGDIVHHVSYSGETLSILSRWYTLDVRNTGRIARINALNNPSQLNLGDTIIIPSYLVKNNKYLSESTLQELFKALQASR
jgi:hypothetical protein